MCFYIRFEVFTAVNMKNLVFLDMMLYSSCKKRRFGGTYPFHHPAEKKQLLVTANVVPSSLILFTLMMEAICSSETSILTRTTPRHIPEEGILHESVSIFRRAEEPNRGCVYSQTKKERRPDSETSRFVIT
jgi:hypothetical protein